MKSNTNKLTDKKSPIREEKTYRYTNKITGKTQLTHPGEDDGECLLEDGMLGGVRGWV